MQHRLITDLNPRCCMIAIVDAVDADADGDGGYSVDVDADGDGNRWTVFFWTRGAWRIVAIHTGALFGSSDFGELIKIVFAQSSVFGKFTKRALAQSFLVTRKKFTGGRMVLTGEQGSRKIWKVFWLWVVNLNYCHLNCVYEFLIWIVNVNLNWWHQLWMLKWFTIMIHFVCECELSTVKNEQWLWALCCGSLNICDSYVNCSAISPQVAFVWLFSTVCF